MDNKTWISGYKTAPWWEWMLARIFGKRVSLWPGHLHYEWRGRIYLVKNEPMEGM